MDCVAAAQEVTSVVMCGRFSVVVSCHWDCDRVLMVGI